MKKLFLFGIGVFLVADLLLFLLLFYRDGRTKEAEPYDESRSIADLLLLAKEPLGQTMYIWGGGWNKEDTGAGEETRSLGLSPMWKKFADRQDGAYDYQKTRYQIHDGLDCSGYIGWVVYNLMETRNGEAGYVTLASEMATDFSDRGFGEFTEAGEVSDWMAGDIMSMEGHVWMVLGSCEDGSVVLIHSSPPGVRLCGTRLPGDRGQAGEREASAGKVSEAERLAEKYMRKYYPDWYERYPRADCDYRYLTDSSCMRWSSEVLADEEGLRKMSAEGVLQWLFDLGNKR